MRIIKKIAWRIYNKITKYKQKNTDEFEYELWKRLESEYYELVESVAEGMINDEDRYFGGAYVAYRFVWCNIYENYFNICKKLGRLEEFYRLQDLRNEQIKIVENEDN